MSLYIIAEPGSTHVGKKDQMLQHIIAAKAAGADAVKFQWVSDAGKLARRRNAPTYEEAYQLISFPKKWLEELAIACHEAGIDFLCTAYLSEDLDVLAPLVHMFKVASFEAADKEFLRSHDRYQHPILLSTGMMTLDEAADSIGAAGHVGGVLHCVSAYPTPVDQVHLDAIYQLRQMCRPIPVGFSDHTKRINTGAMAVAAGAEILEVHTRLEGTPPDNADYGSALGPISFKEYVGSARLAEKMVGYGRKRPQTCEQEMMKYRVVTE